MVLVTIALVMVQEMAVRLGAYTGKGLGALIREQFSLRLTALAVFCLLLANTGLVVSEFAGIGAAFEFLGVPKWAVVPPAAILLWSLVLFGSYRWAERIFLLMSLAFFAYPIAMILGHPHWGTVGSHLVIPHMQGSKAFILLAVTLIGTTVSPYMQFYAAAGVVDRGARPEDYRLIRADAVIGAVFACVISLTIITATASAIGGTGPLTSAAQAAKALEPVAGQGAELLFALGLIGASALAGAVVPLSASYAVGEAAACGTLGLPQLPRRTAVPRCVHRPDRAGRDRRPDPGQRHPAADRHPGPPGPDHPHRARLPAGSHQPSQRPRQGSERPALPHRGHRRGRRRRRDVHHPARPDRPGLVRPRLTLPSPSRGRVPGAGCNPGEGIWSALRRGRRRIPRSPTPST